MKELRFILLLVFGALHLGCRSGHFEKRAYNQSESQVQARLLGLRESETASRNPSSREWEFQIRLTDSANHPIRNHRFEVSISHPSLLSAHTLNQLSNSHGVLSLRVLLRRDPLEFKGGYFVRFQLKSNWLPRQSWEIHLDPEAENFRPSDLRILADSQFTQPDRQHRDLSLSLTPEDLMILGQQVKDPQSIRYFLETGVVLKDRETQRPLKGLEVKWQIFTETEIFSGKAKSDPDGRIFPHYEVVFAPYESTRDWKVGLLVEVPRRTSSASILDLSLSQTSGAKLLSFRAVAPELLVSGLSKPLNELQKLEIQSLTKNEGWIGPDGNLQFRIALLRKTLSMWNSVALKNVAVEGRYAFANPQINKIVYQSVIRGSTDDQGVLGLPLPSEFLAEMKSAHYPVFLAVSLPDFVKVKQATFFFDLSETTPQEIDFSKLPSYLRPAALDFDR